MEGQQACGFYQCMLTPETNRSRVPTASSPFVIQHRSDQPLISARELQQQLAAGVSHTIAALGTESSDNHRSHPALTNHTFNDGIQPRAPPTKSRRRASIVHSQRPICPADNKLTMADLHARWTEGGQCACLCQKPSGDNALHSLHAPSLARKQPRSLRLNGSCPDRHRPGGAGLSGVTLVHSPTESRCSLRPFSPGAPGCRRPWPSFLLRDGARFGPMPARQMQRRPRPAQRAAACCHIPGPRPSCPRTGRQRCWIWRATTTSA